MCSSVLQCAAARSSHLGVGVCTLPRCPPLQVCVLLRRMVWFLQVHFEDVVLVSSCNLPAFLSFAAAPDNCSITYTGKNTYTGKSTTAPSSLMYTDVYRIRCRQPVLGRTSASSVLYQRRTQAVGFSQQLYPYISHGSEAFAMYASRYPQPWRKRVTIRCLLPC